jgi:quercetin dioxygenase-like cupin family protein
VGEVLTRPGRRAEVKLELHDLVVFEFALDPHTDGAGPHYHARHVDSFLVLEGELEVLVGEETVQAKAGDLVAAAPGVVHGFANRTDARTRFVNMHAPGFRFADYMRRMDAGEDFDPLEYDVHECD